MKTYVVALENHDDVISARDKIAWSKANRVLLVWPRRGRVLERRVDLLLLQRYAQSLGAQLGVVSGVPDVRSHARDLGIPVFANAAAAQDAPWRRPRRRGRLRVYRLRMRRPVQGADSLRERRRALREHKPLSPLVRLAVFTVGLLAFFSMLLLFLPGAEIRLTPERVTQQFTIPVWASPDLTAANPSGGLPAQVVSVMVEGRDQAPSSGQTRTADSAASGQVTVTNLTDQPVDLPAGSIVLSKDNPPARYMTVRAVRVPAGPGKTVSVMVRAEAAGQGGNLGARRINALEGPLGLRLSVENRAAISGGRDRTGPAPSQADYRALREKLLADLRTTAEQEIQSMLLPGQVLMPGTLRMESIVEETRQPEANQPGDQLVLGLRVAYQAQVVREADLQSVAQTALDANLKEDYQPVPGSLRFALSDTAAIAMEGSETQRWEMRVERDLVPVVSEANLARDLRGHSPAQALETLNTRLPLVRPTEIDMFPDWWPRLPFLPFRIRVVQS